MNCPKCGEPINEYQHYCSNCGLSLDDKTALFDQCKRATKKSFLAECQKIVPEKFGANILGRAAWFIAANAPHRFDYLQGDL